MKNLPVFWILKDKFLAGPLPQLHKTEGKPLVSDLLKLGITCFIDLTADETRGYEYWLDLPPTAKHIKFSIRDFSVPDPIFMKNIIEKINYEINHGGVVYLHCWGGKGRTGTVLGCWLKENFKNNMTPDGKVLLELWRQSPLSVLRPEIPETTEQKEYIKRWCRGTIQLKLNLPEGSTA